ncbi:MAG: 1-acyl-sn-glycerol-3-phosphate acyltransferase [Solirubrobacterales bacterium]|nr:1-acyl-sn-glycerol-3-phosphate acyltransferase [Solirubrobacterales bacterium]
MTDVELRPQVYKDPRPEEYFAPFHERVRRHEPEAIVYETTRVLTVLCALTAFRARGYGAELVPNGPVILAPNHASFMDHFFTGAFIRRRVQFMGKSQLFKGLGEWIFSHGGVFPVRRGHHDEEAFITAFKILDRGGAVVMYCEGGRSRTGKLADEAKPGIGRLALESGAPVVPVAILGSYQVRNWRRLQFPRVTVQFGEPFKFEAISDTARDEQQQAADYIFAQLRTLHAELERLGHKGALRASRPRPTRPRRATTSQERRQRRSRELPPPRPHTDFLGVPHSPATDGGEATDDREHSERN